ncbi:MAG TPA: hypothetical protein VIO80_01865, partial [Candidatus Dormibacteraeota bacterium]
MLTYCALPAPKRFKRDGRTSIQMRRGERRHHLRPMHLDQLRPQVTGCAAAAAVAACAGIG